MKYILGKDGITEATLFFRVHKRTPNINVLVSTGIKVDVKAWNSANSRKTGCDAWKRYDAIRQGEKLEKRLTGIEGAVANLLAEGKVQSNANKDEIEKAVNLVVNHDARVLEEEEKARMEREKEEQGKNILLFLDKFLMGIATGDIRQPDGELYKKTTIANWESFGEHAKAFCKKTDTFDIINKHYADRFVNWLGKKGMMPTTINKYVICFRKLCNKAGEDGVNKNGVSYKVWKEISVSADSKKIEIYLTEAEIDALYNYPFEGRDAEVIDTFLLGCWSYQRFSDYGSLSAENFGTTMNGTPVIKLKQKKTGTYVEIPILDDRVFALCKKYDYNFPQIDARRFNDCLQDALIKVAEACPSLMEEYTTNVLTQQEKAKEAHYSEFCKRLAEGEILKKEDLRIYKRWKQYADAHNGQPLFKRNVKGEIVKYKYELVTTHTARRTGATNAYKSGVFDKREMMSLTGHTTEKIFEEYIKVGTSEMADRIAKKVVALKKSNNKQIG